MNPTPFNPSYGTGQVVSSTSPAADAAALSAQDQQVCVTNLGSNVAYVRVTGDTAAATTADCPVPPGAQIVLTKGAVTRLSHISAAGTSLHIITGNGW